VVGSDDDRAPARRPGQIADSLRSARPGDVLFLDRRGDVLSRAARRRRTALSWARFGVWIAFVGVIWGGLAHSAVAGVVAGGATAAILVRRSRRRARAVWRVSTLVAGGRFADARAALDQVRGADLDEGAHLAHDSLDYRIDWMMGARSAALDKCERVCRARGASWSTRLDRVYLLAVAGRGDDARRALADAAGAPTGEFLALRRETGALRVAFLDGKLPHEFDSERLHAHAREVLLTEHFGALCLLLAWAFERRGDVEMSRHLLGEAPARLVHAPVARFDPALAAWRDEALRRAS
jgi:hypothetical protein